MLSNSSRVSGWTSSSGTSSISTGGSHAVLGGSTNVNGSAIGIAMASGIDAGAGRNTITNSAALNVDASTTSDSNNDSSAGLIDGNGYVSASTTATAHAVGINAGDGGSVIVNSGVVTVNSDLSSYANSHAGGGDASLLGLLGGDAYANSSARAAGDVAGIRAGAGDHQISNSGTLTVEVNGTASAYTDPNAGNMGGAGLGLSSAIMGVVNVDPNDDVIADGIVVGDGSSLIINTGTISVRSTPYSTASTDADGVSLGYADGYVRSETAARAAGIRAGNGDQRIYNQTGAHLTVNASTTSELTISTDAGSTDGGSGGVGTLVTSAYAVGISAGNGANLVVNDGRMDVSASAGAFGGVYVLGGRGTEPLSNVEATGTADAIGFSVGDGRNTVINRGTAYIISYAGIGGVSSVDRYSCTACGGDNTAQGDITAIATVTGIKAGNGNNWLQNDGDMTVIVSADAELGWGGDGDANHREVYAKVDGMGIQAGNGNNVVVNNGTLIVSTNYTTAKDNGNILAKSWSTATGVRTGSGNDRVVNNGTISASVETDLANVSHTTVVGIDTGAGDDTIINNGTISVTQFVDLGSSTLPIITGNLAIDAGAGNDTISLGATSVVNGDIDFGASINDRETLVLEGTPTVNGRLLHADFVDVIFNNSGSFSAEAPFHSATKNGAGTFTYTPIGNHYFQNVTVNQGTLRLNGSHIFSNNGLFQARINGDGTYGQFSIRDVAIAYGNVKIVNGGGTYTNGTTFDVITAGGGFLFIPGGGFGPDSGFAQIDLPQSTPLLSFSSQRLADRLRVQANAASFTTVTTNQEQNAIARRLDGLLPTVTGDLRQVLGQMQTFTDAQQFETAFRSLSPAVYGGYSATSLNGTQQYTNVVQTRTLTRFTDGLSTSNNDPIQLAYNDGDLARLLDTRVDQQERLYGLWIKGFSQKGDQTPTDRFAGFEYSINGSTIGYDVRVTPNTSVGMSIGSVRNHVQNDLDQNDARIDGTLWSAYTDYIDQGMYLNGTFSSGRNGYDVHRNIIIGSTTTPVTSKHYGDVLAASVGGGYFANYDKWWTGPFAGLQYTRVKEEGFRENGSGAGLIVDGHTTSALSSTLGIRVLGFFGAGSGGQWIPEISLAWVHDFGVDNRVINASYVDAPNASFSIDGQSAQRDGAMFGAGISYRSHSGMTSSLKYTGESRDKFNAQGWMGELRFEF